MTVIVFDLDGTLLDASNQIVGGQLTINFLKRFQRENYQLAICTGRLDHDIVAINQKFDLKINQRISENGAVFYQGNKVNATILNKDEALKINSYLESFDDVRVEMNTISNRYWKTPRDPDFPKEFYDSSIIKSNFTEIIPFQPVILFLIVGQKKRLQEIQKKILGRFNDVHAILTSNTSLEIVSNHVSKGLALKKMFPQEKVYAIGDSESDLTMSHYVKKMFYVGTNKKSEIISVTSITDALQKIWEEEHESTISTIR